MVQISLSSRENAFIRHALMHYERYYIKQVNLDRSLLEHSVHDRQLFERFLREDMEVVSMAKSLYSKFLDAL